MTTRLVPLRLTRRAFAALVLHVVAFAVLYWLAYSIRFEFAIPTQDWLTLWLTLPGVVVVQTIVFYYTGHCHRPWYRASFSDLVMLFRSATLSWLILVAFGYLLASQLDPPRSVLLLDWGMTVLGLGALRAAARLSRAVPIDGAAVGGFPVGAGNAASFTSYAVVPYESTPRLIL